ncbi:MAG: polyprenyl synthetase family protein [Betaproteobacteria bacterium]|jgi:farnesyl diphosphate synthase|nr:polyprenyl synthetase family protein [Betaproteobacteria bacterium]
MNSFDIQAWSSRQLMSVEQSLMQWVPADAPAGLGEAMRYAVLDGGKRLRPLLVLASMQACAGDQLTAPMSEAGMRAACAVELIHAYSLVHDDMPCMDNDVLRRGKPTVHVKYGQAGALLAGDALQSLAFELLTPQDSAIPAQVQARLCGLLAHGAGHAGMAGGQAIDLASVGIQLSIAQLRQMHRCKTGALLETSVLMGAQAAQASMQATNALLSYGQALGIAFQVVDDILDVTADTSTLGKTAGKDAENNKPTYVSFLGLDGARKEAAALAAQAQQALADSALLQTQALQGLADWVLQRQH